MVNLTPSILDRTFGALSDPTRRAMLRRLAHGPATVAEIGAPYPMTAPAISKHLRVLERAGLIERRREGREAWCQIRPKAMLDAVSWIEQQRGVWEGLLDSLGDYLNAAQDPLENKDDDDER